MKYDYSAFQQAIVNLKWDKDELAARLSAIGHESEVVGDQIDVTLTSNRKDCQDFQLLIFDLCGVYSDLEQSNPPTSFSHSELIPVTITQVSKLLGSDLDESVLIKLEKLGFIVEDGGVRAPTFRTGIETIADIAEEVLRVVGFDTIPIKELSKQSRPPKSGYYQGLAIKQKLVELGLFETRTYSFSDTGNVQLKNPFSAGLPYLRESLLSGLLTTASKNPYLKRISCFEIGHIFGQEEKNVLGVLLTGQKNYDSTIAAINQALGTSFQFAPVEQNLLDKYDVKQSNAVWAQLQINEIRPVQLNDRADEIPVFKPISKFPPLVRDVTLSGSKIAIGQVLKQFTEEFPELLFAEHIDSYTNPETHNRSETFRLFFQKMDSSFVEDEIRALDQKLDKHFIEKQ